MFDYYAGGAESESTLRDNRAAFSRYRLLPCILIDVSRIDTTCELLGSIPAVWTSPCSWVWSLSSYIPYLIVACSRLSVLASMVGSEALLLGHNFGGV